MDSETPHVFVGLTQFLSAQFGHKTGATRQSNLASNPISVQKNLMGYVIVYEVQY